MSKISKQDLEYVAYCMGSAILTILLFAVLGYIAAVR